MRTKENVFSIATVPTNHPTIDSFEYSYYSYQPSSLRGKFEEWGIAGFGIHYDVTRSQMRTKENVFRTTTATVTLSIQLKMVI